MGNRPPLPVVKRSYQGDGGLTVEFEDHYDRIKRAYVEGVVTIEELEALCELVDAGLLQATRFSDYGLKDEAAHAAEILAGEYPPPPKFERVVG